MLTKKIISSSLVLAMSASLALFAGCETPAGTEVDKEPTASESAEPSESADPSASADPVESPAASPSTTPSASADPAESPAASPSTTPSATNSSKPTEQTGGTSDIKERATFNGKVLDRDFVPVEGATVTAKSIDPGVEWVGEATETINGAYVFRNAPVGARVQVVATKPGWTTRVRTEVLKSNLTGDPNANVFNFGGTGTDAIFAVQDEPEITSLKINGKTVTGEGSDITGTPAANQSTNISGVTSSNLEVEMTFSEPVDREDFENVFRINSMVFTNSGKSFDINENLSGVDFTWSEEDKKVIFKTNKAVLSNTTGDEARYNLGFEGNFKDKTDKESNEKKIRFTASTFGDNTVFSVKNDETDPKISNFQARDGGGSNDELVITYSEALNVINKSSDAASLVSPLGNGTDRQSQNDSSTASNGGTHNFTLLGYKNAAGDFKYSYMVGLLRAGTDGKFSTATRLMALENITVGATEINGSTVTIDLSTDAFKKDDKVLISAGSPFIGKFNFKDASNVSQTIDLGTSTTVGAALIEDPAGRRLSTSNSSESGGISISDNQRVSTGS